MSVRVALLASASSIHTIRWVNGLAERGMDVLLLSAHPLTNNKLHNNVKFRQLSTKAPYAYFSSSAEVKKLVADFAPDILNVHYASGYGLLARLVNFKPTLLSVWGSDVYDFPRKSFLHRLLIKKNLSSATAIASTSHCMAEVTRNIYNHHKIFITPFGIDVNKFFPSKLVESSNKVRIGTVKTLGNKYGIDVGIKAFAKLCAEVTYLDLQLSIYGGGPDRKKLEQLVDSLGVSDKVVFGGLIPHDSVPQVLKEMDIYFALSRLDSESFGVAILEANACGLPVVVSDADGLKEVVIHGKTGFVVPKEDYIAASDAMKRLVEDVSLRKTMGSAGREHVLNHYTWEHSLDLMIEALENTIKENEK